MIVLDTSALIGAINAHYLPDSIGGFWTFLDRSLRDGRVVVPRAVYEELRPGSDAAHRWVQERRVLVVEPSEAVQASAGDIVTRFRFRPGRDRADPFVIAEAQTRGFCIATYEGMSPTGTTARLKARFDNIPSVCKTLGVVCHQPARAWCDAGLLLT